MIEDGDVEAHVALVPASDQFVPIILDAVDGLDSTEGLVVSTDHVASRLVGAPEIVFDALSRILVRAAASGAYTTVMLQASRVAPRAQAAVDGSSSRVSADAASAIRHLGSMPSSGAETEAQFTFLSGGDAEVQEAALALFQEAELRTSPKGAASRMDGDVARVFGGLRMLLTEFAAPSARAMLTAMLVVNHP